MSHNCPNCEDTGCQFDTLYPCQKCDKGLQVQYEYNKQRVKSILTELKFLRQRIKVYESRNSVQKKVFQVSAPNKQNRNKSR